MTDRYFTLDEVNALVPQLAARMNLDQGLVDHLHAEADRL